MITVEDLKRFMSLQATAEACRVTKTTVWSWVTKGVTPRQPGGERVKLLAYRVGSHWLVPPEAINKFLADCNPGGGSIPESPVAEVKRLKGDKKKAAETLGGAK
jgi:hypothetical protein